MVATTHTQNPALDRALAKSRKLERAAKYKRGIIWRKKAQTK